MNASRFAGAALLSVALFTLVGCSGPTFIVQHYEGPARPSETVAIVRVLGSENVRLVSLNGEAADAALDNDVRLHIEVLPGEHTLALANAAAPEQPVQTVSFQAGPGRFYRPVFVKAAPGGASFPAELARIYEVSRDGDEFLRDVTSVKTATGR